MSRQKMHHASVFPGQPEEPLRTDGDRPLRMKIITFVAVIASTAVAVDYGVSLKRDVATHGQQLESLVSRQFTLETEGRAQRDLLLELRAELRYKNESIAAKLDYLTNGRKGEPPH